MEVIRRHVNGKYRAACVGFVSGFPFLSGLPQELTTPRRAYATKGSASRFDWNWRRANRNLSDQVTGGMEPDRLELRCVCSTRTVIRPFAFVWEIM